MPRSTLYAAVAALETAGLVRRDARGAIALTRRWVDMAIARDRHLAAAPASDEAGDTGPARTGETSVPGPVARSFLWNPDLTEVVDCARFARGGPITIGFSNGSLSNPWRTALVHSVVDAARRHAGRVARLEVRHAEDDAARQADQLDALVEAGVDILLVSPVDHAGPAAAVRRAAAAGLPIVMVDRTIDDAGAYLVHVGASDTSIGRIPAQWLAERLGGAGSILMLAGARDASPAEQRVRAALEVFHTQAGLDILDVVHTGWTREGGRRAVEAALAAGGRIDGVWCDSGLQGVGALDAFAASGVRPIPPHTGGDLNAMYRQAIGLGVDLAAMDYPPSMGRRAIEACLDMDPREVAMEWRMVRATIRRALAAVDPDAG